MFLCSVCHSRVSGENHKIYGLLFFTCSRCSRQLVERLDKIYDSLDPYRQHRKCDCDKKYEIEFASSGDRLGLYYDLEQQGLFDCQCDAHAVASYATEYFGLTDYSVLPVDLENNDKQIKSLDQQISKLQEEVTDTKDIIVDFMHLLSASD